MSDDGVVVAVPGLPEAFVGRSGGVTVRPDGIADPHDLEWLLDRPVREAQDLLAGRFALRAAAVTLGERAVALVGHGASGKSVAAAALAQRGHPVLADHRLVLDTAGGVTALPATARLDLWPDAIELLDLDPEAGAVVRPALAKRAFAFAAAEAAPLAKVIVLDRQADVGEPKIEPLTGGDAIAQMVEWTAGAVLLDPLGLRAAHFAWMVAVAGAASFARVRLDRHHADPQTVADAIERAVAE